MFNALRAGGAAFAFLSVHGLCTLREPDLDSVKLRRRIMFETLGEPLAAFRAGPDDDPRPGAMLAMAVAASIANMLLWFDDAEQMDRTEHAQRLATMLIAGVKGSLAGTCDRMGISCARAWLLLGDR